MNDPFGSVRGFDKVLIWSPVLLVGAGFLFIYSAKIQEGAGAQNEMGLVAKQGMWVVLGFLVAFATVRLPYPRWAGFSYWLYAASLVGLLAVLVVGSKVNGARRWVRVGPFSVQPSEFAKVAVIFALARYLSMRARARTFGGILGAAALLGPPLLLILVEPNLGTALLLVPVFLSMLWVCGIPWRSLGLMGMAFAACGAAYLAFFAHGYHHARIEAYASRVLASEKEDHPARSATREDYQQHQAEIAVGSGGIVGRGYLNGTLNRMNLIPESENDFIFAVAAEEFGFLGSMGLLALYAALVAGGFWVAYRTEDPFGRLWVTGFTVLIAAQTALNLGVVLGLLPVTGVPLPFLSEGGSSLVTCLFGVGMLVNIGVHRVPSLARKD